MDPVMQRIGDIGIVPVIRLDSARKAVGLGKALVQGGIPVAEVTFRTAAGEEAVRAMSAEIPGLLVGAGTVLTAAQAARAIGAGARFIVSPAYVQEVVDYCLQKGVPVLPGVTNPDGVARGLAQGLEVLKFFPAEASGGTTMLDALAGPFGAVKFIPTGGIDVANLGEYARRPQVLAIGGSWMVKQDLVESEQWEAVERLCREAVFALHGFSFAHLGINGQDEASCRTMTGVLAGLFGLKSREGAGSIFLDERIEITKMPFLGEKGHIAIHCNQVERAVAYFAAASIATRPETAKSDKGLLKSIYLDLELGGFALHLLRA